MHRCCCGCGSEVVTPLSPTDWKLTFDGVSVSLDPSVGNWSLNCRSHYWIKNNKAVWAGAWSDEKVAAGRVNDKQVKERYFDRSSPAQPSGPIAAPSKMTNGWTARIRSLFSKFLRH
ncbi:DUF6527 family protein [Pleomorphomonas oryzae]|uniref:DUF6527 family protein n=1 Tax=Pleomorphomonas oryzae TaxID=261934 RepID=UPI003CCBADC5